MATKSAMYCTQATTAVLTADKPRASYKMSQQRKDATEEILQDERGHHHNNGELEEVGQPLLRYHAKAEVPPHGRV
jgi:hypothetical protein